MVKQVTDVVVSPDTSAPEIIRTNVDGKESISGKHQYKAFLVPPGVSVTVEVKVDGVVKGSVGPWLSEALQDCNALARVGIHVSDWCKVDTFPEPTPLTHLDE